MKTLQGREAGLDLDAIGRTYLAASKKLISRRVDSTHWEGELSSSALSTATAVCALELVRRNGGEAPADRVQAGVRWLAEHQNPDGGFGDTANSVSNLSTTALAWAALGLRPEFEAAGSLAERWMRSKVSSFTPQALAEAVTARYGKDRTFSVPILTTCALTGRFGEGARAWEQVPPLPFELAALPPSWFRILNLQVVSYALPALIALGLARHVHRPAWNPVSRLWRSMARGRTLRLLETLQPESGGFLEATPLTSFVTMSLAASGECRGETTRKAVEFLLRSVRADGSWPIDTNLATWVTALSLQALGRTDELRGSRRWLLGQQHRTVHPYTRAAPGGWAWTDRSGGVPDADDTSGVLLTLAELRGDPEVRRAAGKGVTWLLGLQNRDGGIPTFCRGWGNLSFDRSCPDLTAHALRAWDAWRDELDPSTAQKAGEASDRAVAYLLRAQRADGTWVPLWFGNQAAADESNPLYGTSRVMLAAGCSRGWRDSQDRALAWLLSIQNGDGGFGGAAGLPSTIEETALGVEALAARLGSSADSRVARAAARGCRWLAERTGEGAEFPAAPIGLYFARLWYAEALYPIIFTVSALGRILRELRTT